MKISPEDKQNILDIVYEIADEAQGSLSCTKREKILKKNLFKYIKYIATKTSPNDLAFASTPSNEVSVIENLRQNADDRERALKRFFTEHLDVALEKTIRNNMGFYSKTYSEMKKFIVDVDHQIGLIKNAELTSTQSK